MEDPVEEIMRIFSSQREAFDTKAEDKIRVANDKTEPNAWLARVGWAEHLEGLDPPTLRETMAPVREDEEPVLHTLCESFDRVMDRARSMATFTKVGLPALFEIQRKDANVKPSRPFDNRMEDDSWARYKGVWLQLLRILYRNEHSDKDETIPPYRLTRRQDDAFDALLNAVVPGGRGAAISDTDVDRKCLALVMALLDHPLKNSSYDNAIISGLAVMGLRDDGGWVDAIDYTPIYSAVIKVARMMEQEDEVARLMQTKGPEEDEDDVRDRATGIFTIVRGKVQRFMTTTSADPDAKPMPMDWIYESRTYGMSIRFNTTASGTIDWDGQRIKHRSIKFTMDQMTEMLHSLVGETRALLARLTMVEVEGVEGLPSIEWNGLEDDHSEDRVGYSFLHDDRNGWLAKGEAWVLRRIMESKERTKAWFCEAGRADNRFRINTVREYGRAVEEFRERLWIMMHMVAGQPARSTEILGIRYVNTVNGGIRNVMAHNRMMCFVTSYHKNFRSTGQAKVIHRYLPREIGELLVWYLWLALPFWQDVQGIVKKANDPSPFLWSDEVVSRSDGESRTEMRERVKKGREDARQVAAKGSPEMKTEAAAAADRVDASNPGFADWIRERRWTSDRARRILQRHSERLLGTKLTISAWRHMAIAIAHRFLDSAFKEDGYGDGDEDEDDIEDNPLDLQAGHGTHVAGMIYARELQQGHL